MWAILAGGISVVSPPGSSRLAACFRSFAALLARLNRQATQATNYLATAGMISWLSRDLKDHMLWKSSN